MLGPTVRYERRTREDAGDPQPPKLRDYSHEVKATRGSRTVALSPIESIGIYQDPQQMMLPIQEATDGNDAPLYGIGRMFSSSVSTKPLSQFDRQVFNAKDAYGRYGADIKLATSKK